MAQFSALLTVEDYINDARVLLQDLIAPYRYTDDQLLTALNLALLEGLRVRPDLFIYDRCYRRDGIQQFQEIDTTQVRMERPFRVAFVYGTCSHALSRDQEDTQDRRADDFQGVFESVLLGVKRRRISKPQEAPSGSTTV